MTDDNNRTSRLVALFLAGCFLFNYPLLSLFNLPKTLAGIPLLYAYLFGAWILLIVLVWIMSASRGERDNTKQLYKD